MPGNATPAASGASFAVRRDMRNRLQGLFRKWEDVGIEPHHELTPPASEDAPPRAMPSPTIIAIAAGLFVSVALALFIGSVLGRRDQD